jgi:hypothetical protein
MSQPRSASWLGGDDDRHLNTESCLILVATIEIRSVTAAVFVCDYPSASCVTHSFRSNHGAPAVVSETAQQCPCRRRRWLPGSRASWHRAHARAAMGNACPWEHLSLRRVTLTPQAPEPVGASTETTAGDPQTPRGETAGWSRGPHPVRRECGKARRPARGSGR